MAHNNYSSYGPYNQNYGQNPPYEGQGQYGGAAYTSNATSYTNPSYPSTQHWAQPPANQQYQQPNAPYQYPPPPPAPPPQSQQVPNYMNYNPGVYGAATNNHASPTPQAPALPPRTQDNNQGWNQGYSQSSASAGNAVRPSVSGSVRYNFNQDPSRWQPTPAGSHPPNQNATGYNSGPWPDYHESPQPSPIQPQGNTPAVASNRPYSPRIPGPPTLPPRPQGNSSPQPPGQYSHQPPFHTSSNNQANAQASGHNTAWFNSSGSIFPVYQPPISGSQPVLPTGAQSPPPMPPRPSVSPGIPFTNTLPNQGFSNQNGPVSPIEHRDSLNSLYESPPPRKKPLAQQPPTSSLGPVPGHSVEAAEERTQQASVPPSGNATSAFIATGPSDWEHFEPGPADDIDDTATYVRKESTQQPHAFVSELDSVEVSVRAEQTATEPTDSTSNVETALPKQDQNTSSVATDVPPEIVRTESPTAMDEPVGNDGGRPQQSGNIRSSIDTHVRKLTMEESHFSQNSSSQETARTSSQPMDIASNLDVWYKNSLMRYIAMLYKEVGATAVEEKRKIFQDFMRDEASVRGITIPLGSNDLIISGIGTETIGAKALQQTGDAPDDKAVTINTKAKSQAPEEEDDTQYSPGGRPIIQRPDSAGRGSASRARSSSPSKQASSPKKQPASPVKPFVTQSAPVASVTQAKTPSSATNQLGQPPQPPPLSTKPAYVPFRVQGGETRSTPPISPSATNVGSPTTYKPYIPPDSNAQSIGQIIHAQNPAVLSRPVQRGPPTSTTSYEPTVVKPGSPKPAEVRSMSPSMVSSSTVEEPSSAGQAKQGTASVVHQLEELVLSSEHDDLLNPRIENLKTSLLLYPSDYTFVTSTFDKWKTTAAANRARADIESRNRQNDSQQHIDALFNENQISYSDISLLEDSFKKQEGQVRSRENEAEYESYLSNVFDPLYKRLQEEIGAVTELLLEAQVMAKEDGVAGKGLLNIPVGGDKVDMAEALRLVVELHLKLEERYDQLSECIVKRDRRRQAIDEVATKDADKLTHVEFRQRLDLVEKQANVTRCEDRKARTQPLWQISRACAFRGIRENKALISDIAEAIEAAGDELVGADQTLLKVRTLYTLEELAKGAKSMAGSFYSFDVELNLVEYNAAVAHATFDKAPRSVVTKLTDEKSAEDVRLKDEHVGRANDIDASLRKGQDAVEQVSRGLLGHSERALQAQAMLEDAKRRNGDFRSALSVLSPS